MRALPPESATWRDPSGWTWERELAAAQVEITDRWGRYAAQQRGAKPAQLPKAIHIQRPGATEAPKPKVETDPRRIAAWFSKNVTGRG